MKTKISNEQYPKISNKPMIREEDDSESFPKELVDALWETWRKPWEPSPEIVSDIAIRHFSRLLPLLLKKHLKPEKSINGD